MAITRSQQARQLYKNGRRVGLFGGMSPGAFGQATGGGFSDRERGGNRDNEGEGPNRQQKTPKKKPKKTDKNTVNKKNFLEDIFINSMYGKLADAISNSGIAYNLNAKQRENYLKGLKEKDPDAYNEVMQDLGSLGYATNVGPLDSRMGLDIDFTNLNTGKNELGEPQAKEILGKGYQSYLDEITNRFIPVDGPGSYSADSNIYIPPAIEEEEKEEEEEDVPIAYRFMADGGRAAFQEGGIFSRIDELGNDISSAEQELTSINQRLDTAQSSLGQPSGGGGIMDSSIVPDAPAVEATPFPAVTPDAPIADNISVNPVGSPQNTSPIKTVNPVVGGGRVPGGPENPNIDIGTISIPGPISGPRPAVDLPGGMPSKPIMSNQVLPMINQATLPPLQGGGPRIPRLPPNVNTGISNLGTYLPLQTAQQAGSLVGYGKPADPRMGGVQVAGNPLQEMMRGSFADGGMPEYQGGIMDIESGRQQYFLGKLVKKATRAVKKVVKSPFGKALLLGGLTFGVPGVRSGFFNKGLMGTKSGIGFKNFLANKVLGEGTNQISGGLLSKLKSPLGYITGASLLAGLTAPKSTYDAEEEDDFRLEIPEEQYRFYAEGGEVEPVAKKTMPLLDMDGKEMDFRAEGGFVPIGRMEKADDVPARLSKNEFVFTADAVRNAGDGNIDKGAEVMYNMMKNLEAGGEVSDESQGLDGAKRMFQTSQRLEEVL